VPGDCCSPEELCNFHLLDEFEGRKGLAYKRGREWADDTARRVGREARMTRGWPDTPRMRAISLQLVRGLAKDPRLLERFATCCAEGAAERWRSIQRFWR
jgi:hypothetical protein